MVEVGITRLALLAVLALAVLALATVFGGSTAANVQTADDVRCRMIE